MTRGALKSKSEFNFDSGNSANLEGGIAILRTIEALRILNFQKVRLVKPHKNVPAADLVAEKNRQLICWEVKSITKQSSGRKGQFFEEQVYLKILENIARARAQLEATASDLGCTVRVFVCVMNWFEHSIYLGLNDYQAIVNRLENDCGVESLAGIDGVLFVTKMGQMFFFLNDSGKSIDDQPLPT